MMDDADVDRFATAIARALQQARSVSDSEHYDHHVWIKQRIEAERSKLEFWNSMRTHVLKWGAISVVSAGVYALWLGVRQILHLPPSGLGPP